jgi:hypothetical protein
LLWVIGGGFAGALIGIVVIWLDRCFSH